MGKDDTPSKRELANRIEELERQLRDLHPSSGPAGSASPVEMDCGMPVMPPREMDSNVSFERESLIRYTARKWVNETVIRYYFFDSGPFAVDATQKAHIEQGFDVWRGVGIGLIFEEVSSIDAAEVRIGSLAGDGYWSYVGTDVLNIGQQERTMNFGSPLSQDSRHENVAVHEIGHTLGFPHEHQNPLAGIVWDEPAVLNRFSGPPNNWDESKIRHNILRKIPRSQVDGSDWDRDSIMHYSFPAGLINEPVEFQTRPLSPAPGLSDRDKEQALFFYPSPTPTHPSLTPFQSVQLDLVAGRQADFSFTPSATRTYTIQTFGRTDSVMVLFEDVNGDNVFVDGDDDSGWGRNAQIRTRLYAGRSYNIRIRMYYKWASGSMAVMLW
jgi:hypothetical protein